MGGIVIAGTWRATAPAEDVWRVVVDLGTWPRWWPAIREVELLGGAPGEPDAARLTFDTPAPLRPLVVGLAVTDRDQPVRLEVATTDGPLTGTGLITIAPDDHGSATRFHLDLAVRSLLYKPVELLLAGAARGRSRERLRRAGDDLAALAGGEPREHDL